MRQRAGTGGAEENAVNGLAFNPMAFPALPRPRAIGNRWLAAIVWFCTVG